MAHAAPILLRPFLPPLETVRHYSLHKFRKDLLAGLTVSVVEVPQSMAYALIAGVPAQYGLYSSIIQGIIGALLSSSEHITTGPTNTQSLLIASAVTRLADPTHQPAVYLELVFALTFLKGLIQLGFAAARFGDMVRYVSQSVIIGVAAGAGVWSAVGQIPKFLGIDRHGAAAARLPGVIGSVQRMWPHLREINGFFLMVGAISLVIMVGARALSRFVPAALLAVVVGATIVAVTGHDDPLRTIGNLPRQFPHFHLPSIVWERGYQLLTGALALALIGVLEAVAIAKSIATHTGERISANQECFAQGLKNLSSSFFQCIPGSASFTRSALDYAAGAQTRFAAVYNALFVAIIYYLAASQARHIPLSSLAAVLLVIGWRLFDWRAIARIARTSRPDAVVCIVTLLATILAPLEYAIFIGIFVNIAVYLNTASRLHVAEMIQSPTGGGTFLERPVHQRHASPRGSIVFLQLEGELFFAVADELNDHLAALQRSGAKVVILRLKRTHSIDATVLQVLERFVRDMHQRNAHVILCGLRPELIATLRAFGLIELLGDENVFQTGGGVWTSAKLALQRARALIGRAETNPAPLDNWAYEI
jgi:SulP family sulfate permease